VCVYDVILCVAEIGKSSLLCTCRCCRVRITYWERKEIARVRHPIRTEKNMHVHRHQWWWWCCW